jgi:hypothetical protein
MNSAEFPMLVNLLNRTAKKVLLNDHLALNKNYVTSRISRVNFRIFRGRSRIPINFRFSRGRSRIPINFRFPTRICITIPIEILAQVASAKLIPAIVVVLKLFLVGEKVVVALPVCR